MQEVNLADWTTTKVAARVLGVTHWTIYNYIAHGILVGSSVRCKPHYTDTRVRKTQRARWRITIASLMSLITQLFDDAGVPRAERRYPDIRPMSRR